MPKKSIILKLFIVLAVLASMSMESNSVMAASKANVQKEYYYEPSKTTLKGILVKRMYYGAPNYGENPETDEKEYVYLLKLEKPIKVTAKKGDKENTTLTDIQEIQLVATGKNDKQRLKEALNKEIRLQGMLFSAITGHHYTKVLMNVTKVFAATAGRDTITAAQLTGNWLEVNYLEALQQQKNEKAIYSYKTYPYIRISKSGKEYSLLRAIGFHEGINARVIGIEPTATANTYDVILQPEGEVGYHKELWRISKSKGKLDKLTVTDEKQNKINYALINSRPEEYVNQIMLAGNYKDKDGKIYTFKGNQTAAWPDRSFQYEVILDSDAGDKEYGYFYTRAKNQLTVYYCFKIIDQKLYLYNAGIDEAGRYVCTEPSFAELEKQ
jgi:hypothetical protein